LVEYADSGVSAPESPLFYFLFSPQSNQSAQISVKLIGLYYPGICWDDGFLYKIKTTMKKASLMAKTGKKVVRKPAQKKKSAPTRKNGVAKRNAEIEAPAHQKYKASKVPQTKQEALDQLADWDIERKNTPPEKKFLRCFTAYDSRTIALALKEFQKWRDDEKAFDFDIFYDGLAPQLLGRFVDGKGNEVPHGITKKKTYNKVATIVAKANAIIAGKYSYASQQKAEPAVLAAIRDSNWRTPLLTETKYKRFGDDELQDIIGY
jgi:hypothetical protein